MQPRRGCIAGATYFSSLSGTTLTMNPHKIWLDTDIGSDIDDALALAFLLNRPDCDLLGISTVTEIEAQRAQLASVLCRIADKNVPIFPGTRDSLIVQAPQQSVPQAVALPNYPHQSEFPAPAFAAIAAMRAAIHANPGEVTLLGIGPMTNIALLFAIDPQIPGLLKQLVLMCGHFMPPGDDCEWNALNDPHATAMVYAAPVAKHVSIGIDVTQHVTMKRDEFEEKLRQSKYGAAIIEMAGAWFGHSDIVTFHDPLAAATIFEPDLCQYQSGHIEIEIDASKPLGFTRWKAQQGATHQIATSVDADKFFQLYFRTI